MVNALVIPSNTHLARAERTLRAAQYVRMSTDHQKYSIQNQVDAIAEYAALRGFSLTRTYADEGRSGLRLDGRNALKQLIADVQNRQADYEAILVYDVSRWGRFQDADESAYYEFICKEAGIQIIYCAEEFENDGSLSSTLLKSIKRAMAAEYSRELSNKVFIGQCRTAKMGFWRGGQAPFGLRRQLLDEHGRPRMQMEYRQRKILQTDRVILIPGPSVEIATVRRVFRSYVEERKSITTIASELNADEIKTTRGMKWTANAVDIMLTNETYLGNIVFNRRSFKLQRTYVDNPPEMWIRHDKALAPIISPAIFRKAQQLRRRRVDGMTDQEALERLAALWRRAGSLSTKIIEEADGVPSPSTYIARFGSLANAYSQIGFELPVRLRYAYGKQKIKSVMAAVVETAKARGGTSFDDQTRILTTAKGLIISLRVAWHYAYGRRKEQRWYLKGSAYAKPALDVGSALTLVIKMQMGNREVDDYHLIPTSRLALSKDRHFRFIRRVFAEQFRYDTIEKLCAALASA
jgi:DNA invertase Pin-like site-specific DNA recombinase